MFVFSSVSYMFYASERIIKVSVGSRCCLRWGLSYAFRIAMQTLSEFFLSGMGCSCTEWNRRRVQAQMFLLSWPLPQLLHQSLLCSYLEDILTEKIWSIFLALFFLLHSALWKEGLQLSNPITSERIDQIQACLQSFKIKYINLFVL